MNSKSENDITFGHIQDLFLNLRIYREPRSTLYLTPQVLSSIIQHVQSTKTSPPLQSWVYFAGELHAPLLNVHLVEDHLGENFFIQSSPLPSAEGPGYTCIHTFWLKLQGLRVLLKSWLASLKKDDSAMKLEEAVSIPRVGIPVGGERRDVGCERWKEVG